MAEVIFLSTCDANVLTVRFTANQESSSGTLACLKERFDRGGLEEKQLAKNR